MGRKRTVLIVCGLLTSSTLWTARCGAQEQAEAAQAQTVTANSASPDSDRQNGVGFSAVQNFVNDQKAIWTSPFHLKPADADWLLPLGAVAGGLFATDTEFEKHLSNSPTRLKYSKDFSNAGLAAFVGVGAGMYVWGHVTHDEHKRETGFLAGEAAVDSLAATYALKYAFGRERPLNDNYQGGFWQGGDSFPSEHSAAAWAMAGVIAHEYPGPLTSVLAYGLAAGISGSRLTGKQHFPSDVLIGSAIGWFIGQEVYRHHHDPELDGGAWPTYSEWRDMAADTFGSGGSPYVELDSWIYPAIERLAAMGYIHSEFLGMRPWTRDECAELVDEAGDAMRDDDNVPAQADQLYTELQREFHADLESMSTPEAPSAHIESIYSRVTNISGLPLNDSYHFGQTIINDYGRPYQQGLNAYDGFSAYTTAGRFTMYVRGEYQHAPGAPAYPLAVRQVIATADDNPVQPAIPIATTDRFTLLDTYISAKAGSWNLSFGKQSLWWGPEQGGALLFSNNAAPIYMFRATSEPVELPSILHWLGPIKTDFFLGKLSGHEFPARPLIHGEKISFKPTPNLELGFTRTTVFSGVGRANMTLGLLKRTYLSIGNGLTIAQQNDSNFIQIDPGDRHGGFDLSYRVPRLFNGLTFYTDSLAEDDPSPLANPQRAPFRSGIYIPELPVLHKMDFRAEGVYTDAPNPETTTGGFFIYWNGNYHDSYTNDKNVLGDWIGREGKGVQAWTTYWVNSRDSIQFGYRQAKVSKDFIPFGETLNDGSVRADWWIGKQLEASGALQYEQWLAPILAPGPQTNWTSTVQITFYPSGLR